MGNMAKEAAGPGLTGLTPCQVCGKSPRFVSTLTGGVYVACLGHLETEARPTQKEVTALWNAGIYEQ